MDQLYLGRMTFPDSTTVQFHYRIEEESNSKVVKINRKDFNKNLNEGIVRVRIPKDYDMRRLFECLYQMYQRADEREANKLDELKMWVL